jgi:hypothetical protein
MATIFYLRGFSLGVSFKLLVGVFDVASYETF